MLAAPYLGTKNLSQIAEHTGIGYDEVRAFGQRLQRAGIWTDAGEIVGDWEKPGEGAVPFWLDVSVAADTGGRDTTSYLAGRLVASEDGNHFVRNAHHFVPGC
jgi:hypothetical protein